MNIESENMKPDSPGILLVNPWIYDFAAFDFWARPYGLLQIASMLRNAGFNVYYQDCLDRFHPNAKKTSSKKDGRGAYLKTTIEKPPGLEDIDRRYSRYGIMQEWFMEDVAAIPKPDLILVTSLMTYWYPGVFFTIEMLRQAFPGVRIVLGGIYSALSHEHAVKNSKADLVTGERSMAGILNLVSKLTQFDAECSIDETNLDTYPLPALDLQRNIPFVPLLTSRGCPFSCSYCASNVLEPAMLRRSPGSIVAEIESWQKKYNVTDFAFYDDALLIGHENHAVPMLEKIVEKGIKARFHTPNALHIREINDTTARLMKLAGFKTIRLGLETSSFSGSDRLDRKVTRDDFSQAVTSLKKAGFETKDIGAYLLACLPGQSFEELFESITIVKETGITPVPAYYSPVPKTGLWDDAVRASKYDINADPIFTNNAVFPCADEKFSWEALNNIRDKV